MSRVKKALVHSPLHGQCFDYIIIESALKNTAPYGKRTSVNNPTKCTLSPQCKKVPCKVCGPEKCPIVNTTICEDKEKTVRSQR